MWRDRRRSGTGDAIPEIDLIRPPTLDEDRMSVVKDTADEQVSIRGRIFSRSVPVDHTTVVLANEEWIRERNESRSLMSRSST